MKSNISPSGVRESGLSAYEIINDIIRVFTILTEASDTPSYLFQNDEGNFLHISSAFSELMNISYVDFKSSRVTDFSGVVHEKDLDLLIELRKKSEELLADYRLSGEDLCRTVFSTNFRIKTSGGDYRYVDHHSYPIYLKNYITPLISVNMLRFSNKRGIDRLTFYSAGRNIRLIYSQKQKKFVPENKMRLKDIEIEILRLSSEGFVEKQICDKLDVKPSKINYYKREIFNKLNVASVQEAVYVALLSGLI